MAVTIEARTLEFVQLYKAAIRQGRESFVFEDTKYTIRQARLFIDFIKENDAQLKFDYLWKE